MELPFVGDTVNNFVSGFLSIVATLFVLAVCIGLITLVVIYIADVTQTKQAIRRNYPVVGHFRYFFEHLGEFFRQYFFSMDREELPFNRAERSWVYRAAKHIDTTVAFGSTRDLKPAGTTIFVNCAFPTLGADAVPPGEVTIGPYAKKPYVTRSLYNISGMSYGALSAPAITALANGAKKTQCWMNTGEGGVSPFHLEPGCDLVVQIGTAKYGVRDLDGNLSDEKLVELARHEQVRMFEIKLSQGAKPGKGGILPGAKVSPQIAEIRGIRVGEDSISPNRHPDINSVDDLLNMINHIRILTGRPVGFKTVIGASGWLDELFDEVKERGIESAPDFITVDGAEGGTGAAPMPLIDEVGLPLREGLPLVVDKLNLHGLRDRVKVIASGKLVHPAKVAWALCMGADFCTSARGFMFALGCIQALQCNKNTCPTGITTHDVKLQRGLDPVNKAQRVASFQDQIEHEVGIIAHSCGVHEPRQLRRFHCRVVQDNGRSVPLDEIYPDQISVESAPA
ncbi:MAG: FMN-binding glutamate synthase family protein [Gammaproteobacteria bacterium]|nr:FMN-binding glutamate synthase family protein [Gammaproteobacteria bacterium]MDH3856753.1 FMN-binding glutamate synthase family protein [Gammaproteobacteria bacterium]